MYLFLISFVLFFIMIILFIVNKRLSKTATKEVYISLIGEYKYTSKMLKKDCVTGGVVGSTVYLRLLTKYLYLVIKDRKKKGRQLETIEKMYFESYKVFENLNIKNTTKYDRLPYVDNYCRIILIAKAIVKKENCKLDYKSVDNFFNEFYIETPLTYNEIISIKDALFYQIYVELKDIAKYVLHVIKMKNVASKKNLKTKYLNSLVYCYYKAQHVENFMEYENKLKTKYYDYYEVASLFHNLNNFKTTRLYNCIYTIKFLNTDYLNTLKYYNVYSLLQNDYAFRYYPIDTKKNVMSKIAVASNILKTTESSVASYIVEYALDNKTDINTVVEAKFGEFMKYCKIKRKELNKDKKKRKKN